MPLIESLLGPTELTVAGRNYAFQRDKYGRAVAQIDHMEAEICLLAVQHYRRAPDVPEEVANAAPAALAIDWDAIDASPVAAYQTIDPPGLLLPADNAHDEDENSDADPVGPAPVVVPAPMVTAEPVVVAKPAPVQPVAKAKGGRPSRNALQGKA